MNTSATPGRYFAPDLTAFTSNLFQSAGLPVDKADIVARILVEADLLGHVTHGLQLCPPYLADLVSGKMTAEGSYDVVRDKGAVAVWDGRNLPGCWLTHEAVNIALEKAQFYGMGSVAIRHSHHIGCLASYLEDAARAGYIVEISCVDPSMAGVAAHGGLDPVFTPDPIAYGIPTDGDPIMIDLSASTTAMGTAALYRSRGEMLPGQWLQDKDGNSTNDPHVLVGDNPGTILPTGGLDHGHKGFSLALVLETCTQGLSGFGRVDKPTNWGAAVQVKVSDPDFFCGKSAFRRQAQWIADISLASRPRNPDNPVRLPGQSGLSRKQVNMKEGVLLSDRILSGLREWAEKQAVAFIEPIAKT